MSIALKVVLASIICNCLAQALIFKCRYDLLQWYTRDLSYSCTPIVTYSGSENTLDGVTGDHLEGKSNDNVAFLRVEGQHLPQILPNIVDFFPNITILVWQSTGLKTISSNDLKPFPDLIFLRLWINKLVELESDLFKYTPKLQYIDFDSNSITYVGGDLLTGLDSLNEVDFRRNPCINILGNTPSKLEELKVNLRSQCSSYPEILSTLAPETTERLPAECPLSCQEQTESLATHLDELKALIVELVEQNSQQEKKIGELVESTEDLTVTVDSYEFRIVELEKLIREISAD